MVRHNDLAVSAYPIKGFADAQQVAIDPRPTLPLASKRLAIIGHVLIQIARIDDPRAWPGSLSVSVKPTQSAEGAHQLGRHR